MHIITYRNELKDDDGDKALVTFANAIRKTLISRNAVAVRWGGDEFVVAGKDADIYADLDNSCDCIKSKEGL